MAPVYCSMQLSPRPPLLRDPLRQRKPLCPPSREYEMPRSTDQATTWTRILLGESIDLGLLLYCVCVLALLPLLFVVVTVTVLILI